MGPILKLQSMILNNGNVCIGLRIQPIDATHCLKRSARRPIVGAALAATTVDRQLLVGEVQVENTSRIVSQVFHAELFVGGCHDVERRYVGIGTVKFLKRASRAV